ncbi:hypothetical protein ABLO27_17680 [Roseibium sp. SCPC15]|uniref:hypothetical protein n=1 Tax=Roseibium sp. SCP15 TaxID=3141376 RepID=UPI003336D328
MISRFSEPYRLKWLGIILAIAALFTVDEIPVTEENAMLIGLLGEAAALWLFRFGVVVLIAVLLYSILSSRKQNQKIEERILRNNAAKQDERRIRD